MGQLSFYRAGNGKWLKEIAKALNRSEGSTKDFAKRNKFDIVKNG